MRVIIRSLVLVALFTIPAFGAETYVGVVSDTMCTTDHKAMNVSPDEKCVRDCVGDGRTYQYALVDGKNVYRLSDQQTPAKFAGKKVAVTGTLFAKTKILKVDKIEPAK